MHSKSSILLKITGEVVKIAHNRTMDSSFLRSIAQQIRQLSTSYYFGVVVGGGNFFRGSQQGKDLALSASVGHQIGMLATLMNGLLIKDVFEQEGIRTTLFSALPCHDIGLPISEYGLQQALRNGDCTVFAGGTGNPFFTTDTAAVLRGLQINAACVWKGTHVDGIYSDDPHRVTHATLKKRVGYQEVLSSNLRILDASAVALAQEHCLKIRVFNIFESNALIRASQEADFGSTIE